MKLGNCSMLLLLALAVGGRVAADEPEAAAAAAAPEGEATGSIHVIDEGELIEPVDRTPERCVATNRIRDTDVIDNQTILFEMAGGDWYSNVLDRSCPGLARANRFMYEVRSGRLCDIDLITVLEQRGAQLEPGFTCKLGQFHPITELEAQELLLGPDEAVAIDNDIEIREVEPTPDGEIPPVEDE